MTTQWHDDLSKAHALVGAVRRQLLTLSEAFNMTGNARMADKLITNVATLEDAIEMIRSGQTGAFNVYIDSVNQGSTNMLKAALAGAGVDPSFVDGPGASR